MDVALLDDDHIIIIPAHPAGGNLTLFDKGMVVVGHRDVDQRAFNPNRDDRAIIPFLTIHRCPRLPAMMQHGDVQLDRAAVFIQIHPQGHRCGLPISAGAQLGAGSRIVNRREQK